MRTFYVRAGRVCFGMVVAVTLVAGPAPLARAAQTVIGFKDLPADTNPSGMTYAGLA